MKREVNEKALHALGCAQRHIERAWKLHKEEGSTFRVLREMEACREDLTVARKIIDKLERTQPLGWAG